VNRPVTGPKERPRGCCRHWPRRLRFKRAAGPAARHRRNRRVGTQGPRFKRDRRRPVIRVISAGVYGPRGGIATAWIWRYMPAAAPPADIETRLPTNTTSAHCPRRRCRRAARCECTKHEMPGLCSHKEPKVLKDCPVLNSTQTSSLSTLMLWTESHWRDDMPESREIYCRTSTFLGRTFQRRGTSAHT
jgi:hypothetical protein